MVSTCLPPIYGAYYMKLTAYHDVGWLERKKNTIA